MILSRYSTRMLRKSFQQMCPIRVSRKRFLSRVSTRVSKQECCTRMSHKSVLQGCPLQESSNVGASWVLSVFLNYGEPPPNNNDFKVVMMLVFNLSISKNGSRQHVD